MTAEADHERIIVIHEQMEAMRATITEAFNSRDRALELALSSMNARLMIMNEFRSAMADQQQRYLSRDEFSSAHALAISTVNEVKLSLSTYMARATEYDRIANIDRAQLDKRLELMNEFRQSLNDQTKNYISRPEHDVLEVGLTKLTLDTQAALASRVTKDDVDRVTTLINGVEKSAEVRTRGLEKMVWMGLGGVIVLGSIVQFLVNTPVGTIAHHNQTELQQH